MISFSVIDTVSESEATKVFLAMVTDYDYPVIVKQQKYLNPKVLEKIIAIDNPHLPKLLQWDENDEIYTLVEEYIDGITLDQWFQKRKPDKAQTGEILLQICDAVKVLHGQTPPIIHRDIKPANLMISADGVLKLIDFNASREYKTNSEQDTTHIGTKKYAPPEQFGFSQTDARSDIYSFGVVIKEFAPEFSEIARKCTMFDPEERYISIFEVERDIKVLLSGKNLSSSDKRHTFFKAKRFAVLGIILSAFVIGMVIYQSGIVKRQKPKQAATADTSHDTSEKVESYIDFFNEETGQTETSIFYFLKNHSDIPNRSVSSAHFFEEKIIQISYKKNNRMQEKQIDQTLWEQKPWGLMFKQGFIDSLEQDVIYDITIETKAHIVGFRLCVTDDVRNIPYPYSGLYLDPDFLEYLRDHPEDKVLTINSFGQKITKIVNMDTKKELTDDDYRIDKDNNVITFSKDFFETLTDDKHVILRIYHTLVSGIEEKEYHEMEVVTRQDAYVPPKLSKRDFTFQLSHPEDLEISIKWNDGKGKLVGIFPTQKDLAEVEKKYIKVKKDSIILSKEYLKKLEKGDYVFGLEFGDIAIAVYITVI